MATHAVIRTGGKQYLVVPGKHYQFEKLPGDPGGTIAFPDVLLTFAADGGTVRVGAPTIAGASVVGTIIRQGRTRKITVVKYKAKSRYRRTLGHRQHFTEVEVTGIVAAPPS